MTDFRRPLYDHYVSTFKGRDAQPRDRSLRSDFEWRQHKFLPLLGQLSRESAILELGCGPGHMLDFLKRSGFRRVRGIDISKEQVDLAVSRGCDAKVADVFEYLNGDANAIDAIVALDFVEHFHKDELMTLMKLMYRSLQKDGIMILQTPNGEGLFSRQVIFGDLTHLTIFTPTSLRQILEASGFEECRFIETGPVPQNVRGKLRVVVWRLVKCLANAIRRIETGKTQSVWTENMICICKRVRQ